MPVVWSSNTIDDGFGSSLPRTTTVPSTGSPSTTMPSAAVAVRSRPDSPSAAAPRCRARPRSSAPRRPTACSSARGSRSRVCTDCSRAAWNRSSRSAAVGAGAVAVSVTGVLPVAVVGGNLPAASDLPEGDVSGIRRAQPRVPGHRGPHAVQGASGSTRDVGRGEAEHLAVEGERGLPRRDQRLPAAEAVPLPRVLDEGVRDAAGRRARPGTGATARAARPCRRVPAAAAPARRARRRG